MKMFSATKIQQARLANVHPGNSQAGKMAKPAKLPQSEQLLTTARPANSQQEEMQLRTRKATKPFTSL